MSTEINGELPVNCGLTPRGTPEEFSAKPGSLPCPGNPTFLPVKKGLLFTPEGARYSVSLSLLCEEKKTQDSQEGHLRTNWESQKATEYFLIMLETAF